jgi:hypothetical protein
VRPTGNAPPIEGNAVQIDRSIAEAVTDLVRPVTDAAESPAATARLLELIGWEPDLVEGLPEAARAAFAACRTAVRELDGLLARPHLELADLQEVFEIGRRAVAALRSALTSWRPPPGLPADLPLTFLDDLVDGLLDAWLRNRMPRLAAVLLLLGARTVEPGAAIRASDGRVVRRGVPRPRLDFAAVRRALTEPGAVLRERAYGGGTRAEEITRTLWPLLVDAARDAGLLAGHGIRGAAHDPELTPAQQRVAEHLLRLVVSPGNGTGDDTGAGYPTGAGAGLTLVAGLADLPAGTAAVLVPRGSVEGQWTYGNWTVGASVRGDVPPIVIEAGRVRFHDDSGGGDPAGLTARVTAAGRAPSGPLWRLGAPDGTRLEIDGVDASLSAVLSAGLAPEVSAEARLSGVRLVLAGTDDPFLSRVLPDGPLTVRLDTAAGFTPERGLRLSASGSLEHRFAVGARLGPVSVPSGLVRVVLTEEGLLALDLTGDLSLALGPLTVSAAGVGVRLSAGPAGPAGDGGGAGGSFGPAEVGAGFRPPTGLGLTVAAGPLSGSGQLVADRDRGRYGGAAQLRMELGGRDIELSALGVIDTRDPAGVPLRGPDGRDAWSLLLVASATWSPGFQLGMGFALGGLGALVGVNRAADPEALRAAVRTRALDSVLFSGAVRDPALPDTLGRLFPVAQGRHLAGLMARVTWGATGPAAPVTADLALFAEFPDPVRVGLLGRIGVVLPDPRAAVVRLRMDAVGLLDLGTRSASLDAALVDSRVAGFTVTGEMAMRMEWGARRRFLLSVGGFHPRFADRPHDVPRLARVAMSLTEGDNPRLRAESYLAVTSNTVQHGARVELRASAAGFTIEGELGYDALIRFAPFGFDVDLHARVAVKRGSRVLLAVGVEVRLSGPNPWHARGRATFKLLFLSVSVKFDVTGGRRTPERLRQPVRPFDLLLEALGRADSWQALPPAQPAGVLVREHRRDDGSAPARLALHPLGELAVSQRVLPLGVEISRIGADPADRRRGYDITGVVYGPPAEERAGTLGEALYEEFADGEYTELSDEQKLSRASFTRRRAGVRVAVPRLRHPSGTGTGGIPHTTFTTVGHEVVGGGGAGPVPGPAAVATRRERAGAETHFALAGIGPAGRTAARAGRFTATGPRTTLTEVTR